MPIPLEKAHPAWVEAYHRQKPGTPAAPRESKHRVAPLDERTDEAGIVFGSKSERLLYEHLLPTLAPDEKLCVHVRFPCIASAPRAGVVPIYFNLDCTIWVARAGTWVLTEAWDWKPRHRKARSRDWFRGQAAFEATYGIRVRCVSSLAEVNR